MKAKRPIGKPSRPKLGGAARGAIAANKAGEEGMAERRRAKIQAERDWAGEVKYRANQMSKVPANERKKGK